MPGLGRLVDASGARFDGRLRIAAVDRRNGKRVMFGSPGSPTASVAQAVLASCSVPWIFAPVRIDGREYVDGGVWSPTNLDATPARRGTEVLCLNPLASLGARPHRVRGAARGVGVGRAHRVARAEGARRARAHDRRPTPAPPRSWART